MHDKLKSTKDTYVRLKELLSLQKDSELCYIIQQIQYSIDLIDDYSTQKNVSYEEIFTQLDYIYRSISKPRVGLTDYFIWNDDFNERCKANKELDKLKKILSRCFN
jgi:hypothetical protein